MMKRELDNIKLNIEQLLKKRSELFSLRENEKIKLISDVDLTDLFSLLSYVSDEKLREVKSVLNKSTDLTESLDSINKDLLALVEDLKDMKETYLNKMLLMEKSSGKKRVFTRGNKRVSVPEKLFNKYVSFYNATLEIDKLCSFVDSLLNEKNKVAYGVAYDDINSLSDEEKCNYYASLAALIMCDEVINPVVIDINKEVCVNEENAQTLVECYKCYKQTRKAVRKRDKKSSIKAKINKKMANIRNFAQSLFGLRRESEVSMALKKSVAVASLSLGVVSLALASVKDPSTSMKTSSVSSQVSLDENYTLAKHHMMKNFKLYDENLVSASLAGKEDFSYSLLTPVTNDEATLSIANAGNVLKLKVTNDDIEKIKESVSEACDIVLGVTSEEVPLEERVEENACEIVAVVSTKEEVMDEELVKTDEVTDEEVISLNAEVQSQEIVNDLLVVKQVPEVEPVNTADIVQTNESEVAFASAVPVEGSLAPDEIIKGYHLTFDNTTYEFTDYEEKALYLVLKNECNGSYQDALVTNSIIVNRLEDPRYPDDLISILSAPGQFAVWEDVVNKIPYLADDFEMDEPIYNAMYDCVYRGIRNNDYVEFKAAGSSDKSVTGEIKVQIAENGNKCHNLAISLDRTVEETEEAVEDEENTLSDEQVKMLELTL